MKLHTQPGGDAGRVLWIHGYTLDSTIWKPLWNRLPRWTHIGVDLPAHGQSREFHQGEGLRELARSLARLADDIGATHLVGMSFGAMVALQTAVEKQEPFATVTLGSPAIAGGPIDPHAAAQNRKLIRLYQERGAGPWMRDQWMSWPPDIFKGAAQHPNIFEELREVVLRHRWTEMDGMKMDRLANFRQTPEIVAKLRSRVLLLVGEDDMPAFKRSAELIRRSAPRSERVYFPRCGHLSLIEFPAESAECMNRHWSSSSLSIGEPNGITTGNQTLPLSAG
ncbi:MAG TPA: alpha/beta hydrolase [Bryobacteraceae bacterium]